MYRTAPFAVLLLAGIAAPAFAQEAAPAAAPTEAAPAAAAPQVGDTILGSDGAEVGKVVAVSATAATVDTGRNKAGVALASIAKSDKGFTITWTRAQLDEAVEKAAKENAGKLDAALVAGAEIKSQDGVVIGKIKEVTASGNVVVEREGAKPIALPKDTITLGADGGVSLLFTAAQFEKAVGAATTRTAAETAAPTPAGS
jgi:hypothetical protein